MSPNNKSRKRVLNMYPEDEIGLITPQRRRSHLANIANTPQPARPSVKRESKPEAAADELCLTEYPTRVSGAWVQLDAKPIGKDYVDRIRVDKTLVCKGFWDRVDYIAHICLPRRSGKTFNMQLARLFFSPFPGLDCLDIPPDCADYAAYSRERRESFFKDSLLKKSMTKLLCKAIARTVQRHLDEHKYSTKPVSSEVEEDKEDLCACLEIVYKVCSMSGDDAAQYGDLPSDLFSALSRFGMCKGNYDVHKGLLAGVFDVDIANDVYILQEICLIPKHLRYNDENGRQVSTLDCFGGKKCDLANAFWFNEKEVALMLALCTTWFDGTSKLHDVILDKIREHYGGYYIDYSDNKYNPWSVCSFIKQLCDSPKLAGMSIANAIRVNMPEYWEQPESTKRLLELCAKDPKKAVSLIKTLIYEYECPCDSTEPKIFASNNLGEWCFQSDARFAIIGLQAGYLTRRSTGTSRSDCGSLKCSLVDKFFVNRTLL
ncbi:hypothetical protein GGI17_004488 [Coemansia sp. S146]|nr:hypothetical protein GGI17_004488 [Coemansia sp. S146]